VKKKKKKIKDRHDFEEKGKGTRGKWGLRVKVKENRGIMGI